MLIAVIQLSDIHFRSRKDFLLTRVDEIKKAVQGIPHSFDACIIAVSGDVAFSGQQNEYNIAYDFFENLRKNLQAIRPDLLVNEIYIPGNHDVFLPDDQIAAHQHDVQGVLRNAAHKTPDTYMVNRCLEGQNNFFDFLAIRGCEVSRESRLRYAVDMPMGDAIIRFHCYNTAALSQRHEKQGELLAPIWLEEETGGRPDLVISMFHHPYSWLESNNSRAFRKVVETSSDMVLSGHEHIAEQYAKKVCDSDQTIFFEGAVLQERGDFATNSGFHVVLVDMAQRTYLSWEFKWERDYYTGRAHSESWHPINREGQSFSHAFEPKDAFLKDYLNDPGAGYTHPAKQLSLDDIYVYPDLEEVAIEKNTAANPTILRGADTFEFLLERKKILIIGGDRSGKTSLAKKMWAALLDSKSIPLSVSGAEFKNASETNIRKVISQHVEVQYGKHLVEKYWQEDREKRALIIDDIHRCRMNRAGLARLLQTCFDLYGVMVIFAGNPFAVQDMSDGGNDPAAPQILSFPLFALKDFGFRLRRKLIEKWHKLGREFDDEPDIEVKIKESDRLVNTLLRKSLLPSYPFFVLTLLQFREAGATYNNNLGAYGFHYEALITEALDKGIKETGSSISVDTIYVYLSRIAFGIFRGSGRYMSGDDVQEVAERFEAEIGIRLPSDLQQVLVSSRLISLDEDGQLKFTYGYIYCYFVARYFRDGLSRSVSKSEIRSHIDRLIAFLHIEDYSNILVFLLYLTKDEETMAAMLAHARSIFSNYQPCNLDSDVKFLRQLTGKEPIPMLVDVSNISGNNESHLEEMDHANSVEIATINEQDELLLNTQIDEALLVNHALKTLHILGQILRNFPSSLDRGLKKEIATECYTIGLRTLNALYGLIQPNLDEMRVFFSKILSDVHRVENSEELAQQTDRLLYAMCLCGSYWIVKHISGAIGLEELAQTYREVDIPEAPLSKALINLSIKLDHFRSFPEGDIDKIQDELTQKSGTPRLTSTDTENRSGNAIAFRPMQPSFAVKNLFAHHLFRQLVCNHFYLYPVERAKRDRICALLGIQVNEIKLIGSWDKQIEPVKRIAGKK